MVQSTVSKYSYLYAYNIVNIKSIMINFPYYCIDDYRIIYVLYEYSSELNIINEIFDRQSRAKSMIVFNLPETMANANNVYSDNN